MKVDGYLKALTVVKDTLIIVIIGVIGWRYFPLLMDPSQTSNFEIAEINLLVVKLKPEASERAVAAPVEVAETLPSARRERQAAVRSSRAPQPAAPATSKSAASNKSVTYFAGQRSIDGAPTQITIPKENVVTQQAVRASVAIEGWSYFGTYKDGKYNDLIFDLGEHTKPEALVGQILKANTDVFVRDDYPKFVLGWTKGDRMGVIKQGTAIEIKEVKLIPAKGGGSRIWVKS